MSKTRKSSRRRLVHIDLSDIRLDTTCINLVPGGLPLSTACEICKPKLDIHTKRSSQKLKKRDRSTHQIGANNIGRQNGGRPTTVLHQAIM